MPLNDEYISYREKELESVLKDLWEYTKELESRYGVWVATRPYMASYPDGAPELGERVRKALGIEK